MILQHNTKWHHFRLAGRFAGVRGRSQVTRRFQSTEPATQSTAQSTKTHHYLQRLQDRLPKSLQRYTAPILNAPVSHVTAFLLLHEITAVVPLLGLAGLFHYTDWLSIPRSDAFGGQYFNDSVNRFAKYFRRKGWVTEQEAQESTIQSSDMRAKDSDKGVKFILDFAAAYAITKALLPVRIMLSAWGTPWFARTTIVPIWRLFRKS